MGGIFTRRRLGTVMCYADHTGEEKKDTKEGKADDDDSHIKIQYMTIPNGTAVVFDLWSKVNGKQT